MRVGALETILWLLPLAPLAALVVGDFRERRIGVWWLVALGVCTFAGAIVHSPAGAQHNFLFNFCLMAGLAAALLLYFAVRIGLRPWFRMGRQARPFRQQMGSGDPLFFLALTPLFAPRIFLLLMIVCLAISLVWWLFNRSKTIPLVGTSGSVVAAYLIYSVL